MIKDIKCPIPGCDEEFPIRIEDSPVKIVCRNIDCKQKLIVSFKLESEEISIEAISDAIRNIKCPLCGKWFPVRLDEKKGGNLVFCKNTECHRLLWIPISLSEEIVVEKVPHLNWGDIK